MDPVVRSMAYIMYLDCFLFVSQSREISQARGNSNCIYLPHQTAEPPLIPKNIRKIRQFTSYIMVQDTKVIPIFMLPGQDVEVSPRPLISASYHPNRHRNKRIFPVQISLREPSLRIQLYSISSTSLPKILAADGG